MRGPDIISNMKYAIYFIVVGALFLVAFRCFYRKRVKPRPRHSENIPVFKPAPSDPREDRFEFHYTERD